MTPRQIELARHALGLTQQRRKSYRNRFMAGPGHADYDEWLAMVTNGDADRVGAESVPLGGDDDIFYLTPSGAQAALREGEELDPEDFPEIGP